MIHLHVRSWHSHLAGASAPRRLVETAVADGQHTLALTDWQTTAGAVQFAVACREAGVTPLHGAGVGVDDFSLILLASGRESYGNLCDLLTLVHGDRENPGLTMAQMQECAEAGGLDGLVCLTGDRWGYTSTAVQNREFEAARRYVEGLRRLFPDRLFIEQVKFAGAWPLTRCAARQRFSGTAMAIPTQAAGRTMTRPNLAR